MIARLRGTLLERRPDQAILEVGGVGYRVFISLNTFYELPEPGRELTLLIHTNVREDAIHLYGFLRAAEREAFQALIGISGVGPKLALAILSGLSVDDLWLAVRSRDAARLTKAPGVGKKTAGRLIVELEGKLPAADPAAPAPAGLAPAGSDAVSALVNLGYPEPAASKAVAAALQELGPEANLEAALRRALRLLSKNLAG
ncbi:MAG: Holliday junction branch migration protein RuvA [Desulfarculus sp.]|nr:Holliday junction branch migration protein RuvA [Desulfarculus sp.]